MKLHLPKLLYAAVISTFIMPVEASYTLQDIAPSDASYHLWDVGGGDPAEDPSLVENRVVYDGDLTLNSGDKLGRFDSNGNLIIYVNGDGYSYTNPNCNNKFSRMLTVNGTLTIEGTAQAAIGGQYKPKSGWDYYSVLRADSVVVNGTGTDTHLQATAAIIGNLTVNSGKVSLHEDQYSGNSSGSAFGSDTTSTKTVCIQDTLTINGGTLNMGRVQSKHNNTSFSHIINAFGNRAGFFGGTPLTITQTDGSFTARGYTYAISGLTITQTGGTMDIHEVLEFSGSNVNTITQSGTGSLSIGEIRGSSAVIDIIQSGSGNITLAYGAKTAKTIDITQTGSGAITLGGGNGTHGQNDGKGTDFSTTFGSKGTYNISLTGSGTLRLISGGNSKGTITAQITAATTEVGAGSSLVLRDAGTKLTTTELTVTSGSIIDNNGKLTVGSGSEAADGVLNVTTGGTLNVVLNGTDAALNVGAAAIGTNTITDWTMAPGSTFGIGLTEDYFKTLTVTNNMITFESLVADVESGSTVNTDAFGCTYAVGDIAGMASEHWTIDETKTALSTNDTGDVILSATLTYNSEVHLTEGGVEDRDFAPVGDFDTKLIISENNITLAGDNSHSLGTEIDGVEVTLAHENALGDGPVSTKGESAIKTDDGVTANLSGPIDNSGDLSISGTYAIDSGSNLNVADLPAAYICTEGNETTDGNGFYREEIQGGGYVAVENGDNATLTVAPGTTVEYKGEELDWGNDGLIGDRTPEYDTYYIRTDESSGYDVRSSDILADAEKGGVTEVTVDMTEENGKLTADTTIDVNAITGTLITEAGADVSGTLADTTVQAAGGTIAATISGSSQVTVSGTDVTTISGDNSYSGGTLIDGGSLLVEKATSLGTAAVELDGHGTLDLNDQAVTNRIVVKGCTIKRAGKFGGPMDVEGDLVLTDNTTATTLTMKGEGSITSNPEASLVVDDVNVQTDADASITADVTVNNDGTITLNNNGNILNVTGSLTLSGVTTLKLIGDYGDGDTLVASTGALTTGTVNLDYDSAYMLEQMGNSLVLTLRFKQNIADTVGQGNWGIATASRAFVNTVRGQRNNTGCLVNGRGTVWFSALGASNDMERADISVEGAAIGADMKLTERSTMGIALGYTDGEVSPVGLRKINQDAYYAAVYGEHVLRNRTPKTSLVLDWVLAYGSTESEQGSMSWEQDSLQLNSRLSWNRQVSDRLIVTAFGGLEYFATNSDTVDGVKTGSIQNLRAEIGVGTDYVLWGPPAQVNGKTGQPGRGCDRLVLHGEVSYFNDLMRNNPVIRMNGVSGSSCNPGRHGLGIEAGATYRINDKWTTSANYSFNAMEDSTEHRLNIGASMSF